MCASVRVCWCLFSSLFLINGPCLCFSCLVITPLSAASECLKDQTLSQSSLKAQTWEESVVPIKGHLLRSDATPIVLLLFLSPCLSFSALLYALLSCLGNEPVKCHCHSDVIIEQRTAGGIGQGGETTMQASKQEKKRRKEVIHIWIICFQIKPQENQYKIYNTGCW